MSRSAFALRFKEVVGEAPLEYLTRWRMYQAGRMLRGGNGKLLEVARMVGYDSDGAFNKAFKRVLNQTPGDYRRGSGVGFPMVPEAEPYAEEAGGSRERSIGATAG
jgi:AraC-like DNA-binding protein